MFNQILLFTTTSWFLASLLLVPVLVVFLKFRSPSNVNVIKAKVGMGFFQEWIRRPDKFFLGIFLGWFWLSYAFRLQPYGYNEWVAFTVGPLIYILFSFVNVGSITQKYQSAAAWFVTFLSGGISLHALVVFLFQHLSRLSGLFRGDEVFVTYPNTMAMFLLAALPFQIYLFWDNTGFKQKRGMFFRVIAAVVLVVNLMALILTFSRGAFLALLITAFFCVILALIFKKWRQILITGLVAGLAFGLALGWNELHRAFQPVELAQQVPLTEDLAGRFSDKNHSADQSSDERLQFWIGAWRLIQIHPWFGVGSDGFRFQYPQIQAELLATSTHPHNLFLKLAAENGVPAVVFFALFLLVLVVLITRKILYKRGLENQSERFFLSVLFAAFMAMNLHLLVDYNLNAVFDWFWYWMIAAVLGLYLNNNGKKISRLINKRKTMICNLIVVIVVTGILIMSMFFFIQYRQSKNSQQIDPVLIAQYPMWAEGQIAAARFFAAKGDYKLAADYFEKGLALNSLNNLDWHAEYLYSLRQVGNYHRLSAKENYYENLLENYLGKLRNNEHNTLTTRNPSSGLWIIKFYLEQVPSSRAVRWQKMQTEYEKIWSEEVNKFQQIFNLTLPKI